MTTASLCVSFINGVFIVLLLRCYCKLVLLKCCSRNITNTRSISRSRIKNSNSSTMWRGGEERRKGGEEKDGMTGGAEEEGDEERRGRRAERRWRREGGEEERRKEKCWSDLLPTFATSLRMPLCL